MGSQRELVTKLLEHISGGHEVAAAHLGMSIGMFRDRLYMNKSRFFDLDEVLKLQELSGTTLVADYYAERAQCMVIPKMKAEQMENFDLYMATLNQIQASGDLARTIKESIENDGRIDEKEEVIIRRPTENVTKMIRSSTENVITLHKKATNSH